MLRACILILVVGAGLRLYRLDEPQLWLDEILRLVRFDHPTLGEALQDLREDVAAVPLDYIIQDFFVHNWGPGETPARLHAALFGIAALAVFGWSARQILGRGAEFPSLLLLATSPLHLFYSREGANYALFFLLSLLSVTFLLRAVEGRSLAWPAFSLVTAANFYTNFLAVTVWAAQAVYLLGLLILKPAGGSRTALSRRRLLGSFIPASAFSAALFVPWVLWTHRSAQADYPDPFQAGLALRIFKETSGGSYPLSLLLAAAAGLGVYSLWKQGRAERVLLLGSWFFVPLGATLLLDWWRGYFFAVRQVLPSSAALLLAAAAGFIRPQRGLSDWYLRSRPAAGLLGLAALLGLGSFALSDRKSQADWIGLAAYLEETVGPEDRIAAPEIERALAFRYPTLREHQIELSTGWNLLESAPGRLLVIDSRYTSPPAKTAIQTLLSLTHYRQGATLKGFTVYHLVRFPQEAAGTEQPEASP